MGFLLKERNCINCSEILYEKYLLKEYPHEFHVYLCPNCGHENDWWIVHGYDEITEGQLESIVRAFSFDSFLQGKEIMYHQAVQHKCAVPSLAYLVID